MEKEENLSRVSGNAWVYGDARVSGDAWKSPICISGLFYRVTIIDQYIRIGCEYHLITEWLEFDDKRILEMDGKDALKFWNKHKKSILIFAEIHRVKEDKAA
ncbi:MAG: hypothetical protein QM500_19300 [Methylococcales bacterium]